MDFWSIRINCKLLLKIQKKPVFTRADKEIYVPLGEKNYAYDKHFKVSDVSDYKFTISNGWNQCIQTWKYSMIVTAVDNKWK